MGEPVIDEEEAHYARLREETMRDKTRTRKPPKWSPPEIIATWPCRNGRCRKPVELTVEGGDSFAVFNRELRKRGEEPMRSDEVLVCDDCRNLLEQHKAKRNTEKRVEMRALIQKMAASKNPEGEVTLLRELERLHHPDIKGLIETLKQKLNKGGRRASKEDV